MKQQEIILARLQKAGFVGTGVNLDQLAADIWGDLLAADAVAVPSLNIPKDRFNPDTLY